MRASTRKATATSSSAPRTGRSRARRWRFRATTWPPSSGRSRATSGAGLDGQGGAPAGPGRAPARRARAGLVRRAARALPRRVRRPRATRSASSSATRRSFCELGVPVEYVEPQRRRPRAGRVSHRSEGYFLPDPGLVCGRGGCALRRRRGSAWMRAISLRPGPAPRAAQDLARRSATQAATAAARRLLVVRPGDPAARCQAAPARRRGRAAQARAHRLRGPPALDGKPGERIERDVDPWGLAFRGRPGGWSAYATCAKASASSSVDRIEPLQVNAQKPHTADFDPPEGFDAATRPAGRASRGSGRTTAPRGDAPVRAGQRAARASGMFDAPDGRLQVTYLDGLVPQILSLGDRVWIESPPTAREKARRALREIARGSRDAARARSPSERLRSRVGTPPRSAQPERTTSANGCAGCCSWFRPRGGDPGSSSRSWRASSGLDGAGAAGRHRSARRRGPAALLARRPHRHQRRRARPRQRGAGSELLAAAAAHAAGGPGARRRGRRRWRRPTRR